MTDQKTVEELMADLAAKAAEAADWRRKLSVARADVKTAKDDIKDAKTRDYFASLPEPVMTDEKIWLAGNCRVSRVTPKRIYAMDTRGGETYFDKVTGCGSLGSIDVAATLALWDAHNDAD